MNFYTSILSDNVNGVAHFIEKMISHNGKTHLERLYAVDFNDNAIPFVRKGNIREKKSNYAVVTGGEVANSFSPLYEIGYFFSALFLAGIGTVIINKELINKYRKIKSKELLKFIISDLESLTEAEIERGMKHPIINIISAIDTDVVPIRYNKHQLWRLNTSVLTKRIAEIKPGEYGKLSSPLRNPEYWTEKDQQIAEFAIKSSDSLLHAKVIQYYLTLQIFFKELGINIQDIPIYFSFVPKDEIIENGPDSSFLNVLIALHTRESRNKYRKITGIDYPWLITKACPNCGQGDKRILSSKLMSDGVTVKVHCKPNESIFRNERGDKLAVKGCGERFSFIVPHTSRTLYKFFKEQDFSINFAARELLTILKDSSVNPVAFVASDLGVIQTSDGKLMRDPKQVKGYGDNLDMLTSALGVQYFFIKEKIAGATSRKLKKQRLLISSPVVLMAYSNHTELVDKKVIVMDETSNIIHVSDTSALKMLENGISVQEMFRKAVKPYAFSIEEMYKLKGKSIGDIAMKLASDVSY